jgi:hypothetical protein
MSTQIELLAIEYMALTTVAFSKNKTLIHQQIGLKFKKETSEMLQFECNYLWC